MKTPQTIFENRQDAGRQLAEKLIEYNDQHAVVLAIPNGGVPVAVEVADALKSELGLIICRRIPIPRNPEAGFAAIADDGTIVFSEKALEGTGINRQQIEYDAIQVRAEIKKRHLLYRGEWPLVRVKGKTAIIIDDGLASGITMMAAVESVRPRQPREIVIAVPCAPAPAVKELERLADKVITVFTGYMQKFSVSDFYHYRQNISDEQVIQYLRQWRSRHFYLYQTKDG